MRTVNSVSMVVYSSLQAKFVNTQADVQIQRYSAPVLRNDIIYVVESVDSDNKKIRKL